MFLVLVWLVMTSVSSFDLDTRLLDENPIEMFNRTLASKSTSTMRNDKRTFAVPSTVKYPPDLPSNHASFTPPLPPIHNPFADKPTLRGSNSDVSNKRPMMPPPVIPKDKDRIPIKRPDLVPTDARKKTINTPSVQKLPDALNYSEPSTSSTTHRVNDTYDVVIPVVQNISQMNILRILNNGNKNEYVNRPRLDAKTTTSKTTSTTTTVAAVVHANDDPPLFSYEDDDDLHDASKEPRVTVDEDQRPVPHPPPPVPDRPARRHVLGVAWDVHVYLMAVLFAALACVSCFALVRVRAFKWLLPRGYFVAVHVLLAVIGVVRSAFLFYDAYNVAKSFSEPVARLMMNCVFPFLVCVFSLMFSFVANVVDAKTGFYYARKSYVCVTAMVAYAAFSLCVDLYAEKTSYGNGLIVLAQCLFVVLCVAFGLTYIIFYRCTSARTSVRKQNTVYGTAFADPLRPSLSHAIRVMLATSLLSLLMAAVQLVGVLFVYEPLARDQQPHPWLWWAFQLSMRVIEVATCYLVFWAAVQPLRGTDEKETRSHHSASGFPLFPWGGTPRGSEHADDVYPTICSASQAAHNYGNYTIRSAKPVYEDIFQYCNSTTSRVDASEPVPTHTTDRRTSSRRRAPPDEAHAVYASRAPPPPQPSPSMLIDEEGMVRFRSIADAEVRTAPRYARYHPPHEYAYGEEPLDADVYGT